MPRPLASEGGNLRRGLRQVTEIAGLGRWHPHELRHSAASLLSAAGVPLEEVADALGHISTRVTSSVYRHRTTPVVEAAVTTIDRLSTGLKTSDRMLWLPSLATRSQTEALE